MMRFGRLAFAILFSVWLIGCSTVQNLFNDSGDQLPAGAFRGSAVIRQQTIPLPVEIAENIIAIEEGKVITGPPQEQVPVEAQEKELVAEVKEEIKIPKAKEIKSPPKVAVHPFSGRRKLTSTGSSSENGKSDKYKVRNGDTLMKIAFAKYGNIFRWRDIYNANRDQLKDFNKLTIGMILVLNGAEYIVIEKNGEPYLIRRGDTLKSISNTVYGSSEYWRNIWKNNPQLIKNPNKIYAGFTLYYRPKSEVVDEPSVRAPTQEKSK